MKIYLTIFSFFVFLTGCTYIHEDIGTPLSLHGTGLSEGETHYRKVLKTLGPPNNVSANDNGMLFLYEYIKVKETQFGIGMDNDSVNWLKFIKISMSKGHADRQAILLAFDDRGILQTQSRMAWGDELGGGVSADFIIAVNKVVDTSGYYNATDANHWGMTLLQALPETLNVGQSLDSGVHGLELTNTPCKAGQHTLEMR